MSGVGAAADDLLASLLAKNGHERYWRWHCGDLIDIDW